MSHNEFEIHVRDLNNRFDYAFSTLIFASLALSVQYSPGMGQKWSILLICSWSFLWLSGVLGGWRLTKIIAYSRNNLYQVKLEDSVRNSENTLLLPVFTNNQLGQDLKYGDRSFNEIKNEIEERITTEKKLIEKASKVMDELKPSINKIVKWQIGLFIMGLTLNLIFAAANYLYK